MAGGDIALGMTGGVRGEGIGCTGRASSDEESVSLLEACYFRWDPVAILCFHAVRSAWKLRANTLSDVAERARYFYDQIAITNSCLVAIGEEVG